MEKIIFIKYGEMTLKKANYNAFLLALEKSLSLRLKDLVISFKVMHDQAQILYKDENLEKIIKELKCTPGLFSYAISFVTTKKIEDIAVCVNELLKKEAFKKYKIETKRSDKTYPLTSLEITKEVAKQVVSNHQDLMVDVKNPDLTVFIELRKEHAFVYKTPVKLLGGFPEKIAGKALMFLSGGIDSPVAAFLMMKKGVELEFIHFQSPPHTSELALQKVLDITKTLLNYTASKTAVLHIVNVTKIQETILEKCREDFLVLLLRRQMIRIANLILQKNKLTALVTGESLGQVASQTLLGMNALSELTRFSILRPLISFDKIDIIKISKQINTYDLSILPYEDCCTVFVPRHPVINPESEKIISEEKKYPYLELVNTAFENLKTYEITKDTDTIYDLK